MSLGRRGQQQPEFWVPTSSLPKPEGHVFYRKLNEVLSEAGFDRYVEDLCEPFYASGRGRPSIAPGVYFRMLLVGYFEGIGSQRGIAWRCGDSLSLREFLGTPLSEDTPHHSSLTRVRDRLPLETHRSVFQFVLRVAAEKGLLRGKTVGVDSTTLEANAAMKSIVRRDTGEDWEDYVRRLMQEEGIEDPTDEEMRRFDKKRKGKKVSNEDWESPVDPDARIARMKDGRTHLAYKAENVVDLDTELVLGASIRHADEADTSTMIDSVVDAQAHLDEAELEKKIEEIVGDKGYHSTDQLELAESLGLRPYIPEPKSPHKRKLKKLSKSKRQALINNRKRSQRRKGKNLQCKRSELVERSFAHMCDTGGARRTWLRDLEKVQKRFLLTAAARNLGLIMRRLLGRGTPRGLAALLDAARLLQTAWLHIWRSMRSYRGYWRLIVAPPGIRRLTQPSGEKCHFSTGC
jgi:transposase